jgi:predicted Rdx family selenoprotein
MFITQFAQELLSTFNTGLGEVSLIPTTGGVFTVTVFHLSAESLSTQETVLWDRKTHGGFPGMLSLSLSVCVCVCVCLNSVSCHISVLAS